MSSAEGWAVPGIVRGKTQVTNICITLFEWLFLQIISDINLCPDFSWWGEKELDRIRKRKCLPLKIQSKTPFHLILMSDPTGPQASEQIWKSQSWWCFQRPRWLLSKTNFPRRNIISWCYQGRLDFNLFNLSKTQFSQRGAWQPPKSWIEASEFGGADAGGWKWDCSQVKQPHLDNL